MLSKFRPDNEKIVIGILSLSQHTDIKFIKQELDWYAAADNRVLYLWRDDLNNWSGLVGVEEFEQYILVRRITLTPAVNTVLNLFKVLDSLKTFYPNQEILGTLSTQRIINLWERNNERRK